MSRFSFAKSAKAARLCDRDLDMEIRMFQDKTSDPCQDCGGHFEDLNNSLCFDCIVARNNRDFYKRYSTATICGAPMTIERITR